MWQAERDARNQIIQERARAAEREAAAEAAQDAEL